MKLPSIGIHLFVRMDDAGPSHGALNQVVRALKQIAVLILVAFYRRRA